jgi:hypothetical protein
MTAALARHSVMPKKRDDSVSPYLRRRLRKYEELARKPEEDGKRPGRSKAPERPVTRDPADRASPDEPDDR